jgi:hypothetical protein
MISTEEKTHPTELRPVGGTSNRRDFSSCSCLADALEVARARGGEGRAALRFHGGCSLFRRVRRARASRTEVTQ